MSAFLWESFGGIAGKFSGPFDEILGNATFLRNSFRETMGQLPANYRRIKKKKKEKKKLQINIWLIIKKYTKILVKLKKILEDRKILEYLIFEILNK